MSTISITNGVVIGTASYTSRFTVTATRCFSGVTATPDAATVNKASAAVPTAAIAPRHETAPTFRHSGPRPATRIDE